MLPKWVDVNEWVAINSAYTSPRAAIVGLLMPLSLAVLDNSVSKNQNPPTVFEFYTNLNMFYGVLTEFCTLSSCTTMAAGDT